MKRSRPFLVPLAALCWSAAAPSIAQGIGNPGIVPGELQAPHAMGPLEIAPGPGTEAPLPERGLPQAAPSVMNC